MYELAGLIETLQSESKAEKNSPLNNEWENMGGGLLGAGESSVVISPVVQLTDSIDLSPLHLLESSPASPAPTLPEVLAHISRTSSPVQ